MDDFRRITIVEYWRLAWPFLVLAAIGIGLAVVPLEGRWGDLLHKAGDAAIIAGLIAIAVELFTLKRLVRHVADDISFRLAGGHLPKQLRRTSWDVMHSSHVREEWLKVFRLTRLSNAKVLVEVQSTYRVKNYSDQAIEYSPINADEVFSDPRAIYVEYRLPNGNAYCFKEDELREKYTSIDDDTHVRTVSGLPTIKLKPIHEDAEAICSVTWQSILTMPDEYTDISSVGGPTIGLTIHASALPDDMTFVAGGPNVRHSAGSLTWEFDSGFINGQHVRVWWFRKRDAGGPR